MYLVMRSQTLLPEDITEHLKSYLSPLPHEGVSFCLEPKTASRPRVTKWGAYYGKSYQNWMKEAGKLVKTITESANPDEVFNLTVLVETVKKRPKAPMSTRPKGDVDNYAKAPLDLLTKNNYWQDDDLIAGLWVTKRWTREGEEPHSTITIYKHEEENRTPEGKRRDERATSTKKTD